MNVPSSPHKRYLSGADWCIAAMSEGTSAQTGRRCIFQIAVFLNGIPDQERLSTAFKAFYAQFPVLRGAPARCWCLAPYWKMPVTDDLDHPIRVGRSTLPVGATRQTVIRHIETLANRNSRRLSWKAGLDIVQVGDDQSVLVFSFDHVLFDAVGAENFINLYLRQVAGETCEADLPPPHLAAPARLNQWRQKFKSGQKVNRMMRSLAQGDTCWLPLPTDMSNRPFRFRVETFTPAEAEHIKARAFKVAGYLMFTPYLLATAAAAFRTVFKKGAADDCNFVVSVSTAKTNAGASKWHVFFNDLSFLYFQFPAAAAADRDALAGNIREQFIFQRKEDIPAAIEDANLLMRILPRRAYWRFLMRFYHNRLSSFGFTSLGESAITAPEVLGCPIHDHIHFPVIPTPPGIGLILNQSHVSYHLVLSYIEGILPEETADAIMTDLRARLL